MGGGPDRPACPPTHSDVDIAVLYRDVDYLAEIFCDPRPVLMHPETGERREWTPDEQLGPGPHGFVIPDDSHPCPITIVLTSSDEDEWVCHRGPSNLLDDERREWLIDNIASRFPDHPWLPALRRAGERRRTAKTQASAPSPPNAKTTERDQDAMRARVDQILVQFGTSVTRASRVPFAQSNEVWIGENVVVRMGKLGRNSLSREVALAPVIPAEVGYPEVLDHGTIDGHEWMASVRLPGENLHEAWPDLQPTARTEALADLWSRLRILHTTDIAAARAAGCTSTRYYDLDPAHAHTGLATLVARGALDVTTGNRLAELLSEAFEAMPLVPLALNHTDAAPGNAVLTPTGHAIPIDLESACVAPMDLDLENLFRYLHFVADQAASTHLANLAADLLDRPGAEARQRGYAILRDLWALRRWFRQTRDTTELSTCAPVQRLHGHAAGTSWLHDIF